VLLKPEGMAQLEVVILMAEINNQIPQQRFARVWFCNGYEITASDTPI
jgi:hypothetical protein